MTEHCTYFDKETFVRGKLTTSDLILEGIFKGQIFAESVLLKKSVQLEADIRTGNLFVEEGASYSSGYIELVHKEC